MNQQQPKKALRVTLLANPPKVQVPDRLKKQRGRFHESVLRVPADFSVMAAAILTAANGGIIIIAAIVLIALVAAFLFA